MDVIAFVQVADGRRCGDQSRSPGGAVRRRRRGRPSRTGAPATHASRRREAWAATYWTMLLGIRVEWIARRQHQESTAMAVDCQHSRSCCVYVNGGTRSRLSDAAPVYGARRADCRTVWPDAVWTARRAVPGYCRKDAMVGRSVRMLACLQAQLCGRGLQGRPRANLP